MFKILNKQILSKNVKRLDIKAPLIAARISAGQFVTVIMREGGEWLSMPVMEADPLRGMISFIFEEKYPATIALGAMPIGEELFSVMGPLGQPVTIEQFGTVVCVASGLGTAQILPVCRALKKAGNKVIGIIGAKTKSALTLEPQIRIASSRIIITTEDGSFERRALASEVLRELIDTEHVRRVYAAGSETMLKVICQMTRQKGIKSFVHLSPVMPCGLGFCGACRVHMGEKTVLSCVDGPFFDGEMVDFEHLRARVNAYKRAAETEGSHIEQDDMTKSIAKFFPGLLGNK